MRFFIGFFIVAFSCFNAGAQEMWGVVNSNYAGINSSLINPGLMADSKHWLDINFITMDAFAENNSFYIPHEEVYFLEIFSPAADFGDEQPVLKDTYAKKQPLHASFSTRIELPSFMLNLGQQAFGFQMSVRGAGSMRGVGYQTSKFLYEGIDFDPQQDQYLELRNMKSAALSWAEFGLTYSRIFSQFTDNQWSAGITLKKIQGLGGAYFSSPYSNYIVYDDSTLAVEEFDAEFAASMPLDYSDNGYSSANGISLGNGWAVDLGLVYQKKRDGNGLIRFKIPCEQKWSSYKYKLGVSILDLGYVKFKDNAFVYSFDNAQTYWPGFDRFDPQSVDGLRNEVSARFAHGLSPDKTSFSMGLPTALSLQYEWHPAGYWFYNVTFVQPTPLFRNSVVRPVQLSFTPRYEKRRFELSVPLSVMDWNRFRFGVAVRFLNITVGTDYFSSWTGWFDLYGSDIYFSWKKSLSKGYCKRGPSEFHKGKRYYKNACPDF